MQLLLVAGCAVLTISCAAKQEIRNPRDLLYKANIEFSKQTGKDIYDYNRSIKLEGDSMIVYYEGKPNSDGSLYFGNLFIVKIDTKSGVIEFFGGS